MRRDLVEIHRQIVAANEALEIERSRDIMAARDNVRLLLGQHGLFTAMHAVRRDPGFQTYVEYRRMVSRIRAGGLHSQRRRGAEFDR